MNTLEVSINTSDLLIAKVTDDNPIIEKRNKAYKIIEAYLKLILFKVKIK